MLSYEAPMSFQLGNGIGPLYNEANNKVECHKPTSDKEKEGYDKTLAHVEPEDLIIIHI